MSCRSPLCLPAGPAPSARSGGSSRAPLAQRGGREGRPAHLGVEIHLGLAVQVPGVLLALPAEKEGQ